MQRYSIIDLGTNSSRLLVADVKDGEIYYRKKYMRTTRFGQGVDKNKIISTDAMNRNIIALKEYKEISKAQGVQDLFVFATSALRDARNRKEFIGLVKDTLDIDVHVVEGQLEAEFAFLGLSHQYEKDDIVVMDVGGGSTEILYAQNGAIVWGESLDIGCVRLTERYIKNDPPLLEEITKVGEDTRATLRDRVKKVHGSFKLIGIGGTATTISSMKQSLPEYNPEKIHNSIITREETEDIILNLISMNDSQRKEICGLDPQRTDVITAGIVITNEVNKYFTKGSFVVSDYDNLEGALYYYINNLKNKK